jgi:hypothetical protein
MNLLIINNGFLGDSLLAGSLAENCKRNGYSRVDLIIGFPQTFKLLSQNPFIDNVYLSENIGPNPSIPQYIDKTIYDKVYNTSHLVFNERPLDTFNKHFDLPNLQYDFYLDVPLTDLDKSKPSLAFQIDWNLRSWGENRKPRDIEFILHELTNIYNVYPVGDTTHFNIDENTPSDFIDHCSVIKSCDVFFGYPGGMHWVAAATSTPTITTSEWVIQHYASNNEFKDSSFDDFKDQWNVHASKNFPESHIILEPGISDKDVVNFLKQYNDNLLQSK